MGNPLNIYISADTIISSLGFSTPENIHAIRHDRTGIRRVDNPRLYESPLMAGAIDNERLRQEAKRAGLEGYSRMEQLFILAIANTLRRSRRVDPQDPDMLLILSSTKGNIGRPMPDMGKRIAAHFGFSRPPLIISTACISGVSALIVASRLIREGHCSQAIVAGGDELSRFVATGFCSFKSVSPEICRPYDARRDGLSLGEACGAVLVTSRRELIFDSMPIVIEGGGISNDANHISGPSRTGDGLALAIRQALKANALQPADLSFVCTHGTATVYSDEMEAKALWLSGLEDIPVNSLKGYWGHTLGAAGLIESIACMYELRNSELFGTYGFETLGVSLPLQIDRRPRLRPIWRCLKTASGFGGCNAAIVFSLDTATKPLVFQLKKSPRVQSVCTVESGRLTLNNQTVVAADPLTPFADFIRLAYSKSGMEDRKFYKMDDLSKLAYIAAAYLLSENGLPAGIRPEDTGIILANASASLDTDLKHLRIIETEGDTAASPAVFVYTLPNVCMGEICIRHTIKGENTFFVSETYNPSFLHDYARTAMQTQRLRACIVGWCELMGNSYKAQFELLV